MNCAYEDRMRTTVGTSMSLEALKGMSRCTEDCNKHVLHLECTLVTSRVFLT